MTRKTRIAAMVLLFLVGLSILLYPVVSSMWNQMLADRTIGKYNDLVEDMPNEDLESALQAARDYNSELYEPSVPDAFSIRDGVQDDTYDSLLNLMDNGMMGSIEIPCIGVTCPVYHYTTEDVLQRGVGHLFGSSLPVGADDEHAGGVHTVVSAHRGLPGNRLFTDLDKMVEGDRFYFHVCGEVFAYEVDDIRTVLPDQTQSLAIDGEHDYATLVTCTPYAVNTHRLLVRGHRVPYVPGEEDDIDSRASLFLNMTFLITLFAVLLAILISILAIKRMQRRNYTAGDLADAIQRPRRQPRRRRR